MATVWVLTVDNSPDPEAFADFHVAFAHYREHIEERTGELNWDDENFEWGEDEINGKELFSCHCYGEFIARLHELEVLDG
jgi:hypothetical protein